MSALRADCRDIADSCSDLGAMFLLSRRHMRTITGMELLDAVKALSRRALDAEGARQIAYAARDAALAEVDAQREIVSKLIEKEGL